MRFYQFIIILPFLWWGFDVRAQAPEELSSSMPEQWELSLDVIKSKAQTLMIENNGLQDQYQQLIKQMEKLRHSIDDGQYKNDQMNRFLKERHGRTDQQVRIDELTQIIKTKRQEARTAEEQLGNLTKKQSDLDHTIQLLKYAISDIQLHQQVEKQKAPILQNAAQSQADDQLTQLRKQLEDENKQEVLLGNELKSLQSGGNAQNLNVDAIDTENKQLESRLDMLRLVKLHHVTKTSAENLAQANGRRYDELKMRKDQLESDINNYEMRMDELRESSLVSLSWPAKRKKLIHEMVQADARNKQMRDRIKDLREDIDVLRDQVARLERRMDFVKGK